MLRKLNTAVKANVEVAAFPAYWIAAMAQVRWRRCATRSISRLTFSSLQSRLLRQTDGPPLLPVVSATGPAWRHGQHIDHRLRYGDLAFGPV